MKLQLGLFENGLHSFGRGIEKYKKYAELNKKGSFNKASLELKEAILFLNHGIELLMKHIIKESKFGIFLIYEDIESVIKDHFNKFEKERPIIVNEAKMTKLGHTKESIAEISEKIRAGKEKAKNQNGNTNLVNESKNAKSATYSTILNRVFSIIVPYSESSYELYDKLRDLNTLRNDIQHLEIDEAFETIDKIFSSLSNELDISGFFQEYLPESDIPQFNNEGIISKLEEIKDLYSNYQDFFQDLVLSLSKEPHNFVESNKPVQKRSFFVVKTEGIFQYTVSFTAGKKIRVEIYINGQNSHESKKVFNSLKIHKNKFQNDFDNEVIEWEELPTRKSSRIAIYRDGSIKDEDIKKKGKHIEWICENLKKLNDVFGKDVDDLNQKIKQDRKEEMLSDTFVLKD
jgi:Domain of unknown function (DUF4268)